MGGLYIQRGVKMGWGKEWREKWREIWRAEWKGVRTDRYERINRRHKVYIHRFTGRGE